MAAVLSRNLISEVSRHRQRGRAVEQGVSPGGKTLTQADEGLDYYCRQQFALEPGLGADGIGLFQMAGGENGFKPFEGQFHLPAAAVEFQHPGCRVLLSAQRGEDENITGGLQRRILYLVSFPGVLLLGPLAGAVKVTGTPLVGFPDSSVTVAFNNVPNAELIGALCGVPAVALIAKFNSTAPMSRRPAITRLRPR